MIFIETELKDATIIELERREDERGFFARTWCQHEFEEHGLVARIVQANMSYNRLKGTLRGMHFQHAPYAETKLVRAVRGAIYDVIIDLRPESPTFKRWIGVELSADNRRALYVPEGFAHGFQTLSDDADVMYQVSAFYTPGAEGGLRYNDPSFDIQWPLPVSVISDKDAAWPDYGA
jgi:dTDP-4-dehydrorhamnose 3,5-epimerase